MVCICAQAAQNEQRYACMCVHGRSQTMMGAMIHMEWVAECCTLEDGLHVDNGHVQQEHVWETHMVCENMDGTKSATSGV